MAEPIVFCATLPPIQSAIKVTGTNDGARIQLDIAEDDIAAAAKLLMVRGKVLRVTVELADDPQTCTDLYANETTQSPKGSAASLDLRRPSDRRDQ